MIFIPDRVAHNQRHSFPRNCKKEKKEFCLHIFLKKTVALLTWF